MALIAAHLNAGVIFDGDSVVLGIVSLFPPPPGNSVPAGTFISASEVPDQERCWGGGGGER